MRKVIFIVLLALAAPPSQALPKAIDAASIERARTIELNELTKSVSMAKGIVPVYFSGEARAKFTKALLPVYENSLNGIVGKDLIERIRKTQESAKLPSGLESLSSR